MFNDAYEAFGEHYMTTIMPARVRKPKQKSSAGGTVRNAATWVIAQLRNRAVAILDEAVRERNATRNVHPFQKREGSRNSVFAEVEAAELKPLPDVRYDVIERAHNRSVNLDFRIVHAKNRYSVHRHYAGRKVDLRVEESTLSTHHAGERITTHRPLPSCAGNGRDHAASGTSSASASPSRRTPPSRRRASGS
ncbi:hypothetical protein [Paraeggerthella sp. Marseille-Q4926]|uniref:Mu transposase domain-containing protein n=1 Tax=Paraeggerthella sp. Marseille-Q4926 TaxID=2866587 RepID=UPI001CE3F3FB|nr:hypothetical protein [Paraeggerthella sp. Marseille-Q4926]